MGSELRGRRFYGAEPSPNPLPEYREGEKT